MCKMISLTKICNGKSNEDRNGVNLTGHAATLVCFCVSQKLTFQCPDLQCPNTAVAVEDRFCCHHSWPFQQNSLQELLPLAPEIYRKGSAHGLSIHCSAVFIPALSFHQSDGQVILCFYFPPSEIFLSGVRTSPSKCKLLCSHTDPSAPPHSPLPVAALWAPVCASLCQAAWQSQSLERPHPFRQRHWSV